MTPVIILEDEKVSAQRLQAILQRLMPDMEVVAVCDSIIEAKEKIAQHPEIVLGFFDIQLSDGLSLELFKHTPPGFPVIFTTAFDEYMLQAFHLLSVDYLLKPIKESELKAALDKWQQMQKHFQQQHVLPVMQQLMQQLQNNTPVYRERISVSSGSAMMAVAVSNIAYFTSENKITWVHLFNGKKYFISETLEEISNQLNPKLFFQINRNAIVQIHTIETVHPFFSNRLLLKTNPELKDVNIVSKERTAAFRKWFEGI